MTAVFSENELILVTGASSGIGRETALLLNRCGARVVGVGRNREKLASLVTEADFSERMFFHVQDLSENMEELTGMVKQLSEKYGKFSGFVHSAGVFNPVPIRVFDTAEAIKDFKLNYFSAIEIMKALANKKNRQELLSVVFISSTSAQLGVPSGINYVASKAALCSAVKVLTAELGKSRTRINAVLPGLTKTAMVEKFSKENNDEYVKQITKFFPFGEIGKPEYVADVIAFLLSKEAYWIQGQCIGVDGASVGI